MSEGPSFGKGGIRGLSVPTSGKILLGFGFALLILPAISGIAIKRIDDLVETVGSVSHTRRVLGSLQGLLVLLNEAETNQRGYLLTGEDSFLEPYFAAEKEIDPELTELRSLTSDNPDQHRRLAVLLPLIQVKREIMADLVAGWRLNPAMSENTSEKLHVGKELMDTIWSRVEEMERGEQVLLAERQALSIDDARRSRLTLVATVVLAVGIVLIGSVALYGDVKARQRAELAALTSGQRLQSVLDNSPAIIYLKDLEGRYILVNRRFEEVFGYDRSEVTGHSDYDLWPLENAAAFTADDQHLIQGGASLEFEESLQVKNSLHTYISVKFLLRAPDQTPYALCGISTDITERKRAERELEALSYSVSHDLRAPLRAIHGFSRVLLEEKAENLDAEGRRLLGVILINTRNMAALIDDLRVPFSSSPFPEMEGPQDEHRGGRDSAGRR
ncbi:MAG: CHASE3 domain-containing protein [Acidobacteria bacterium]|nr:CHASE3 domain-containing protein [Acidobacteriota bacterium]